METIQPRGDAAVWLRKYTPLAPKKGGPAPDFSLENISGEGLMGLILNLSGSRASRKLHDSATITDCRAAAQVCVQSLEVDVPTYAHNLEDSVYESYAAWPSRLYLIGTHSSVMYTCGPGPFGFSPSELQSAIIQDLQEPFQ